MQHDEPERDWHDGFTAAQVDFTRRHRGEQVSYPVMDADEPETDWERGYAAGWASDANSG